MYNQTILRRCANPSRRRYSLRKQHKRPGLPPRDGGAIESPPTILVEPELSSRAAIKKEGGESRSSGRVNNSGISSHFGKPKGNHGCRINISSRSHIAGSRGRRGEVSFILLAKCPQLGSLHSIRSLILGSKNRLSHLRKRLLNLVRTIRSSIPYLSSVRRH